MPLVLKLRERTSIPLEVDSVRMEIVREQSAAAVAETLIQYGNGQVALGEFFDVSGSASDEIVEWHGDCAKVKLIGDHLSSGTMRVEGDAGMHLGAEMSGGEIIVNGNAADWVGAEMSGGRIHVHGDAGHLVGAAYRGGRRGMTGGEILINGRAGNEIGHTMRRGMIAIGGRSGDAPGFNMIAGTILLFGDDIGIRPGAGMRRGTIVYFSAQPGILPTFKKSGCADPLYLQMYLQQLRDAGFDVPAISAGTEFDRYCGDFLETGLGEILVRAA